MPRRTRLEAAAPLDAPAAVLPVAPLATGAPRAGTGRRSLRVAALIDTTTVSGPGRQLTALARELRGYDVDLFVVLFRRAGRPSSSLVPHLARAGVTCLELPDRGPLDATLVWRVATLLRERGPDLVQTHSYRTNAIVYFLRRIGGLRLPWVAVQHGATAQDRKVRFYHWLDRRIAAHADRIVLMSERHRHAWRRQAARVRVIYNAVIPLSEPDARPASLAPMGPRPVFGVVGRLSHEKGIDVFLRACAALRRQGRAFSALVVGDGPELDALLALRRHLDLSDVVAFRPSTPDVRSVYAAVDAIVIPSRSEGLPNVLLEALAEDRPVVATAVGGVPEVLEDPLAGLVVPAGDAGALAEAMMRTVEEGPTASARGARRAAAERFSLDARARAHVALYRELVGDWRPAVAAR